MAISQELGFKLKKDSLHHLMSYRNAFAHHSPDANPTLVVGKTPQEDELHFMLHIIKSSGKTERKRREDALEDFNMHYKLAKRSLIELRDAIIEELQKKSRN